jgi:hypothetical protein
VETEGGPRKGFRAGDSTVLNSRCYKPHVDSSEILPPELVCFWRTDDGLTACERAEAYGIDLSLLDENLRLTPAERLQRNDEALSLVDALQAAVRRART